jgi:hypothetical protein
VQVGFRLSAKSTFSKLPSASKRAALLILNSSQLYTRVRKAASGSGYYYVDISPDLVACVTVDKVDTELLWVLGFFSPSAP